MILGDVILTTEIDDLQAIDDKMSAKQLAIIKMKKWYLLYCKRGEQRRAKMHLENQQVECFYPEVEIEKINRGKRRINLEPLFPSYMFIQFDPQNGPAITTIRSTRGVVDFVRQGSGPQVVQDELVDGLKQMQSSLKLDDSALPDKGESFRLVSGPFAGVEAVYQEADGETRSIMLINMLSKQVEVSVDNRDIEL